MRAFKEFPCTVYELTHNYKIRKVVVQEPTYHWSKTTGKSSRGLIRAVDCYKSFKAAYEAGQKKLAARNKALQKTMDKISEQQKSLDKQLQNHINPPVKAARHVPKNQ